jgi:hypothetical protein
MPWKAKAYIFGVIAVGMALAATGLAGGLESLDEPRYAVYLALALVASTWKVKLPGMRGTMSVNFVFLLIGVAELTLSETLLLGALAIVVQCIWAAKRQPQLVQVLFNVSAVLTGIFASHKVTRNLTNDPHEPAYLALAAFLYFLINTGAVSMVLSLIEKKSFLDIWRNCHLWTLPYYLAGSVIAALVSIATRSVGWMPALLPLLVMYLLYTYYRVYLAHQMSQRPEKLAGGVQ